MKKDKTALFGLVEGYKEIVYILQQVAEGNMPPEMAVYGNPYLKDEIKIALKNAGYIK